MWYLCVEIVCDGQQTKKKSGIFVAELFVTSNKKQKYVVSLLSRSAIKLPDNNKDSQ